MFSQHVKKNFGYKILKRRFTFHKNMEYSVWETMSKYGTLKS